MQFYRKLSELRKAAGLSQEQLAEKAGVSRQTIFKWESGLASPSMENILVLSRLFGVSADELIGNEAQTSSKPEEDKGAAVFLRGFRFEYKSKKTLFGLPLVHVHLGFGLCKAKGIIAVGNLSCGLISVGILSLGLLSFGALALGLLAVAGLAAGGLAIGGAALGAFAVGGVAVGIIAIGGAAVGVYSLGGAAVASRIAATSAEGFARAPLVVSGTAPKGSYTRLVSDFESLRIAAGELFSYVPRWILDFLGSVL